MILPSGKRDRGLSSPQGQTTSGSISNRLAFLFTSPTYPPDMASNPDGVAAKEPIEQNVANPPTPLRPRWRRIFPSRQREESESGSDAEQLQWVKRSKWALGILSDAETDEVPGTRVIPLIYEPILISDLLSVFRNGTAADSEPQ